MGLSIHKFIMKNLFRTSYLFLILLCFLACKAQNESNTINNNLKEMNLENTEQAVFGAGCFWCIEAAFDQLKGVLKVQSGYAGGHIKNPTYKQVCTEETGHAEVVKIFYEPEVISYNTLLDAFWTIHDPTQLNKQGNDVGTQYRSEIFYLNNEQKELAEKSMENEKNSGKYNSPIVTKISALNNNFYAAEDYHTDYYDLNKTQPYCSSVIAPKLRKFNTKFSDLLK